MKIAVIDLGTNKFHLEVFTLDSKQCLNTLFAEKNFVKLGAGGINDGQITPDAWERAMVALTSFAATIKTFGIEPSAAVAMATSAIRSAKNGSDFCHAVEAQTGIVITTIDGNQEANLIATGVGAILPADVKSGCNLIMDIGGGSVEFIIITAGTIVWSQSLEIGGQRLLERYMHTDPPQETEIASLSTYLDFMLTDVKIAANKYQPTLLVGTSGTFETLLASYRRYNEMAYASVSPYMPIPFAFVGVLLQLWLNSNRQSRLAIPGVIPDRVDLLPGAAVLILQVLKLTGINTIASSSYALKEGVAYNLLYKLQKTSI